MNQARPKSEAISDVPFSVRDLRALRAKARRRPQEFAETVPVMTLEQLVAAKVASGDPYSRRWKKRAPPSIAFQLEYDAEVALYAAFDPNALNVYAEALRRCWSSFGIARGDRVAIFDYGTSPVSYLASCSFTPYLPRGAADILGCLPICNDGAANLSQRAVDIVRFVRPRVLFLRADCLHPFAAEIYNGRVPLASYLDALVAVENEGLLAAAERDSYQKNLGVPIYRLLRADAAMFLAPECAGCGLFHIWPDLYHVEMWSPTDKPVAPSSTPVGRNPEREPPAKAGARVGGPAPESQGRARRLLITNWFASNCQAIRYLSQLEAVLERPGCPAGVKDPRIRA